MLRSVLSLIIVLFFAASGHAEMPYREDAGLTKTEHFLSTGKYSAALDEATGVLARHPESADAYTYRAYAYHSLGEMAKATKDLKTALKLNPTHLGANKYLANMYLEEGDMARALEQLQVMRLTCGRANCAEIDALESEIDGYKDGERAEVPKKAAEKKSEEN